MIRNILLLLMLMAISSAVSAQNAPRTGDLFFNISDTTSASDFSKSITASTNTLAQLQVEHVAIFCLEDSGAYVIESTSKKGVHMTKFEDYLSSADHTKDGKPMVMLGRVTAESDLDVPSSIARAKSFIGHPYDFLFSPTDSTIYCSELVQKSFVNHEGKLIFSPIPMSFHDSKGQILPFWTEYYRKRGLDVPEGEPGSNPGQLSRSSQVHLLLFE